MPSIVESGCGVICDRTAIRKLLAFLKSEKSSVFMADFASYSKE